MQEEWRQSLRNSQKTTSDFLNVSKQLDIDIVNLGKRAHIQLVVYRH